MDEHHFLLPAEFEFSHQFSFFLHDQLVETLISGEKAEIYNIIVEFEDEKHADQMAKYDSEEALDWMQKNGYGDQVRLLFFKNLCAALLSDFLHFIYESLQCSAKGKLTVAFALLRKPLKENLFYLEWLLARPADFLDRFEASHPDRFRLPHISDGEESEHLKIIREALEKTDAGDWLDADYIHEIRFKKNSFFGLEPTWQQANHLVTTYKYLETESCNLNFVFSDDYSRSTQWQAYYQFVPILLFHTVQIIEALFGMFAKRQNADMDITSIRTLAGMVLYFNESPWEQDMPDAMETLVDHLKSAELACLSCGSEFYIDDDNIRLFYEQGSLNCRECGETLNFVKAFSDLAEREHE